MPIQDLRCLTSSKRYLYEPFHSENLKRIEENGQRLYVTPTGRRLPSVTTILSAKPNPALQGWKDAVGEKEANRIVTEASRRGTELHSMLETHILGHEVKRSVNPIVTAMYKGISRRLEKNLGTVRGIEIPLWSDVLEMAGTADLVAEWGGELSVIDFKNSRRSKTEDEIQSYYAQTSAYSMMIEERYGVRCKQLVIIMGVINGEIKVFSRSRSRGDVEYLSDCYRYYQRG